jgi:hypothetical protein
MGHSGSKQKHYYYTRERFYEYPNESEEVSTRPVHYEGVYPRVEGMAYRVREVVTEEPAYERRHKLYSDEQGTSPRKQVHSKIPGETFVGPESPLPKKEKGLFWKRSKMPLKEKDDPKEINTFYEMETSWEPRPDEDKPSTAKRGYDMGYEEESTLHKAEISETNVEVNSP